MNLCFGKCAGKSIEEIAIRHPNYVVWMLSLDEPNAAMSEACDEVRHLIEVFDAKPFVMRCRGCEKPATLCTVYVGPCIVPQFWCDACSPSHYEGLAGKLRELRTYGDGIEHASFSAGGYKGEVEKIIRLLAIAKGLPERAGKNQIRQFFESQQ